MFDFLQKCGVERRFCPSFALRHYYNLIHLITIGTCQSEISSGSHNTNSH